jgi:FixJ family two-component response regulator
MAVASRKKILLVEDDDSMREAIVRLLDAANVENTSYASAETLLAQGAWPDAACVVSDLKLPRMSGLDLLAELRARGGCPPLILITAYDEPGRREEAARRGAAGYLVKPFSLAQLLAAIHAATGP